MSGGVLFDLDETLLDRTASILDYARRLHRDFEAEIGEPWEPFGDAFIQLDGNGYVDRQTFFERLAARYPASGLESKTIAAHFAEHAWESPKLKDGARELLMMLKRHGRPVGIVTNGGSVNQRKKIDNSGLAELVGEVLISAELGIRKPDPAIFHTACARLGVEPRQSWFVGDHPEMDIGGAHRAGLRPVWLEGRQPWPDAAPRCYVKAVERLSQAAELLASV